VVWDAVCRGTREVTEVMREGYIMDMHVPEKTHYAICGPAKDCF
jgi:Na+-transporting NADH:ubiquinone oxidoreductase subunit NqrF